MKVILLLTFFLMSNYVISDDQAGILKLVETEIKLLEGANKKGDEIHYRLFELYSERMKLVFSVENKNFLRSEETGKHASKAKFFTKTRALYQTTQNFGLSIFKKYPETVRRGEIFYTLALNSRDFDSGNKAEGWFLESIKSARNSTLLHHAQVSLGDYYYNEKKYKEAIFYYEKTLNDKQDEWLPKQLLNLGWCYLKTGKSALAIDFLKRAAELSKDANYIDIRVQVYSNLVAFWVMDHRIEEGQNYYIKEMKDPYDTLISLAKRAQEKGFYTETLNIIKKIASGLEKAPNLSREEELLNLKLLFFRNFKRWDEHADAVREVVKFNNQIKKLEKKPELSFSEDIKENIKAVAGYHQLSLGVDEKKISRVKIYFSLLQEIDPAHAPEYLYFLGESHYSIKNYLEALKYYQQGLQAAKNLKDLVFAKRILTSYLALLAEEVLSVEDNNKNLLIAYNSYVELFPKDDVAHDIYPKLARLNLQNNQPKLSYASLEQFHKNYPQDLSAQQDIMKELINLVIKNKDEKYLTTLIHDLRLGFLGFKSEEFSKMEIALADILFFRGFELLKAKDFQASLAIFTSVFQGTNYPIHIRALAAYHSAEVNLANNQNNSAVLWLEKSLTLDTVDDLQARGDEWTKIIDRITYLHEIRGAVRLYDMLLQKTCNFKTKIQDQLFQNSNTNHLLLADDFTTQKNLNDKKKCLTSAEVFETNLTMMLDFYLEHNFPSKWLATYKMLAKPNEEKLAAMLLELVGENPGEEELFSTQMKKLEHFPAISDYLTAVEAIKKFKTESVAISGRAIKGLSPFEGELFNQDLNLYLSEVNSFIKNRQNILKVADESLRSEALGLFASFYKDVFMKISSFEIADPDTDFVKSFKGEMKKVAMPFEKEFLKLQKVERHPAVFRELKILEPALTSLTLDSPLGGTK